MASAARITANRLIAEEALSPGQGRRCGEAPLGIRLRSAAAPRSRLSRRELARKSWIGIADPIYLMKSVSEVVRKANSTRPGTTLVSNREIGTTARTRAMVGWA